MQVDFYHLARSPIERVLPAIGEKVLATGGRLLVVAGDEQLVRLDDQLWTY
ncbi:MAG: DNA polymerase III subunit chi, partial [Allosphingosinicella sp.]